MIVGSLVGADVGCVDGWNVDVMGSLTSIVVTAEKSKSDPSCWLTSAASKRVVLVVDTEYRASLIIVAAAIIV